MLFHKGLQRWLPPGGKLLEHELPQDCALREVKEETGLDIVLIKDGSLPEIPAPTERLVQPFHMQLEKCPDGSENVDFIFHARLEDPLQNTVEICAASECFQWMNLLDLEAKSVEAEVLANARWILH